MPTGRPKRVFSTKELQLIEQYARNNSLTGTIATALDISVNTLKRAFGRKLKMWRALGKVEMRDNLYKQAARSPQTAIFIAKNELGMVDKQEILQTTDQPKPLSQEDLAELRNHAKTVIKLRTG